MEIASAAAHLDQIAADLSPSDLRHIAVAVPRELFNRDMVSDVVALLADSRPIVDQIEIDMNILPDRDTEKISWHEQWRSVSVLVGSSDSMHQWRDVLSDFLSEAHVPPFTPDLQIGKNAKWRCAPHLAARSCEYFAVHHLPLLRVYAGPLIASKSGLSLPTGTFEQLPRQEEPERQQWLEAISNRADALVSPVVPLRAQQSLRAWSDPPLRNGPNSTRAKRARAGARGA